ncbi:helicase C-terminal domain-containing protein [Clostridium sp. CCUG 7971]|uniref:helicase C-terminal domain-containing protein n=1 Tax=Clostridium sp. CCUG 7971 TaxID=2811414 RepID=UPI001ABB5626|nr:helicase C-terminal domain-containing protein [Clostridium sp. CCUG 7971]MBO3445182.1 exonuclease [Clostridium sp. CCUG 7971]
MKGIISKLSKTITSVLDNIIYLDIKISGLNPINSEIIEICAVKIQNNETYILDILIKDKKYISLEIKNKIINFLENKFIIIHDSQPKKEFINTYLPDIKNNIIDSMELAAVLEPYHKEYSLEYLKKHITTYETDEKYKLLNNCFDNINIVNSLLIRLKENEKSTLEPLTFKINSYLNSHKLDKWEWSDLIDNANYDQSNLIGVVYEYKENKIEKNEESKERYIIKQINKNKMIYEELLKDENIWASKEGFMYEYRPGQYELTKTIRETFRKNGGSAKIACIEAPTGIGKSVGYLVSAILEARFSKKRVIISTDTKELQIQLINKDIPNVLNSLGLNNKVSYGYIKGKNNYICVEKLESYKREYSDKELTKNDILSIILLERLTEEGKYGDIEEISHLIIQRFKELELHLRYVCCDPNLCRPKKCFKNCLYKNRIEELKEEDITVINHSLLAKWPYKEEKPLENIIVDEGHNLVEKGYEFFSSIIDYKMLNYFFQEIYPYEKIKNSPFIYDNKNKRIGKIKPFDKFYHHVHFDRNIKDRISRSINLIVEEMSSILTFGISSNYKDISKYNLKWELNLQENEVAGKVKNENNYIDIKYNLYSDKIKNSCENIIRNLVSILVTIDRNLDEDSIDKEAEVYKFGKARIKELEEIKTIFDLFMEYSEDDDYARIVDIDKNFKSFELRVVPLKLAQLFEENILSQIDSGIFLSATLSIENNMNYFKNTLGINRVGNVEKIIDPLYDYKKRISIIGINDICTYQNKDFPKEMSKIIGNISQITDGHLLSLFNSKDRQERTYDILKENLDSKNIEVYMNKKGIKNLKDINKRCVVLGSKGCFEGVDVPGDGLTCVTLDKIPNINPKDPLYSTIMKKYNQPYYKINYPQMAIKVKQAMGRILRSKYDYGCFIIFNTGTNINTLKRLEKDLHECNISIMNENKIYNYINQHLYTSRKDVMNLALKEIIRSLNYNEKVSMKKVEKYMNDEMKNRSIKSRVIHEDSDVDILKVKYFNQNYLIHKEKLKK